MTKNHSSKDCPFCNLPKSRKLFENNFAIAIRDAYPVSEGHTLIIPKRHIRSLFETTEKERYALYNLLEKVRTELDITLVPSGYNIGINDGATAGQTVPHLHIHLIPRYPGDQEDPRGGIRLIFPEKARYWND